MNPIKNRILPGLLLFIVVVTLSYSYGKSTPTEQKRTSGVPYRNISITTNVLGPFSLKGEVALNPRNSVMLSAKYLPHLDLGLYHSYSTSYSSITAEYRHYFEDEEYLTGGYVSPYFKVRYRHDYEKSSTTGRNEINAHAFLFGAGVTFGYQKVTPGGFVYNFYGGPGLLPFIATDIWSGPADHFNRINFLDFRIGAAFGYAF